MPEALHDDHLSRLLAPQDTELPWYKSLYQNFHDLIKPEKLPPLELTSKPVAVKDIWGLYKVDSRSQAMSVGIHVAVGALALWGFTNPAVQSLVKKNIGI